MQQQTKLILLFMFLWLVQKAQGQTGKRAENTILKIDSDQNQFTDGQINWLVKNGFEIENYDWNNQLTNNQIEGVFDQKGGVEFWRFMAVASGALAVKKYAMDEEGRGFFITLSLASGFISQAKLKKTRRRIEQINIWNKSHLVQDSTLLTQVSIDRDFHLKSPYKVSQNRYLNNHGFRVQEYNWQNPEVNKYLQAALSNRAAGHTLLIAAVPTTLLGFFYHLVHALSEEPNDSGNKTGNGFLIASGCFVTGSMILTGIARTKVKKAENLRKFPKSSKKKLSISDVH